MTNEEALKLATGLSTDFKCESDTMVDFCNTIIKALKQISAIKQIIEGTEYIQEDVIRYKMICEVLEDKG